MHGLKSQRSSLRMHWIMCSSEQSKSQIESPRIILVSQLLPSGESSRRCSHTNLQFSSFWIDNLSYCYSNALRANFRKQIGWPRWDPLLVAKDPSRIHYYHFRSISKILISSEWLYVRPCYTDHEDRLKTQCFERCSLKIVKHFVRVTIQRRAVLFCSPRLWVAGK